MSARAGAALAEPCMWCAARLDQVQELAEYWRQQAGEWQKAYAAQRTEVERLRAELEAACAD